MVELGGPPAAWERLRTIGRTEDLRFSPSNDRLAIAAFGRGDIALCDVRLHRTGGRVQLDLLAVTSLPLGDDRRPHGLDWLDEDTLVIADRDGTVDLGRIEVGPDGALGLRACPVDGAFGGIRSPGSVRVAPGEGTASEVLVCNNYAGTVTRHLVERGSVGWSVTRSEPLLRRWLDVPDGVAVSPDGRWLAVSNHIPHLVMVYDRHRALDPASDPDAVLRGAGYPHGLAFTADGSHLLVADAGSRFVHAFAADGGTWQGVRSAVASLAVMDEVTFQRGRVRHQEGGPKGLDVDRTGSIVAVTSEHQTLSVHDLDELLRPGAHPRDEAQLMAAELAALADDAERRAGFEADARAASAEAVGRVADLERSLAEAERRAVEAESRTKAALVIAREADARARAATPRPSRLHRLVRRALRRS